MPDQLPEFITQRRRWLNGSFFASTYAIAHAGQILRSGHSLGRKFALSIQVVYNCINLTFSWFAVVSAFFFRNAAGLDANVMQGNFYLFFVGAHVD